MSEFEKEYLRPDYSEEISYDSDIGGPSEDDDDEEVIDDSEAEEEREIEEITKNQNKLKEKIMTQTPFGQQTTGNSSTWGNNYGSWGGNTGPTWNPQPQSNPWSNPGQNRTGWGNNGNTWGGNTGPTWANGNTGKKEINRDKDIIFCDVLDCLIETLGSQGKPGLLPRGIYDVRLRFEVWDKIACFNPKKIYAMIPRNLILSSNGSRSWVILLDYVICALSEYLRVSYDSCQVLTQKDFNQSKDVLMEMILKKEKIEKSTALQIGLESGLYGQSNRDFLASQKLGIDYIDLGQLMTLYY